MDSPSPRNTAIRLFLTCWLIYSVHVATNTVREIYLALAIGDHLSFRVDEYANLHPDLFEKPGYGWHINSNPGASMLAAIPYAASRPIVDRVVAAVNRSRAGAKETPVYRSPWPMAQRFFEESWKRGYDVKFGLAAIVMQVSCMAPVSAFGVVAMFYLLRLLFASDRAALWLSVLYAFGTPVFFRTGYLNHNLLLGHFAFLGFLALWNPWGADWRPATRAFFAGLSAGAAVLLDYSGAVFLLGLFCYGAGRSGGLRAIARAARMAAWYIAGATPPILLLWYYQWRSFGNPFLPAQQWMPPVPGIDSGYQGLTLPQAQLAWQLLFDYRYGLFLTCPLFLLVAAVPLCNRGARRVLGRLELGYLLGLPLALWLFCSGIAFTRVQYNTGFRYLAPLLPFLFVPTAIVFQRLPRQGRYWIGVAAVAQGWCMAMFRDVERGFGALDPIVHVFTGGFQLPLLTVLSRMSQFREYTAGGVSALPALVLTGAAIYGVWAFRSAPAAEATTGSPAAARVSAAPNVWK